MPLRRPSRPAALSLVATSAACGLALAACGLAREAGLITFGANDLPPVDGDLQLTEELLRDGIARATVSPVAVDAPTGPQPPALALAEGATYRDVRDLLCAGAALGLLVQPGIVVAPDRPILAASGEPDAQALVEAVGVGQDCRAEGLRVEASLLLDVMTPAQVAEVRANLAVDPAVLPEAVTQIRFDFERLAFVLDEADVTGEVGGFDLRVGVRDGEEPPELLVPSALLSTIGPGTPQRFELDPSGEVTRTIEEALAGDGAVPQLVVTLSAELPEDALDEVAVEGSGFVFTFQPEVVVDAWAVL